MDSVEINRKLFISECLISFGGFTLSYEGQSPFEEYSDIFQRYDENLQKIRHKTEDRFMTDIEIRDELKYCCVVCPMPLDVYLYDCEDGELNDLEYYPCKEICFFWKYLQTRAY